jgi:hypothetical protein
MPSEFTPSLPYHSMVKDLEEVNQCATDRKKLLPTGRKD